jgi:hypothetical protein
MAIMKSKAKVDGVDLALWSLAKAADDIGIRPPGDMFWTVERGSKTYGRAYRLYWESRTNGAQYRPAGGALDDYLGITKAEAVSTLQTIRGAFWAASLAMHREDMK